MIKKMNWKFTVILWIVGFMLALQYKSMKAPPERDTRDIWAIRHELAEEKKRHSELLAEVRELDKTIASYNSLTSESTEGALKETVDKLHKRAGMTPITGPGFTIEVAPSPESVAFGYEIEPVSSELLTRFINEINRFKGNELEIDGKRFTTLSSIRDINGILTVNGENISTPPFLIKIVSPTMEESKRLYNHLLASAIQDEFYLDNLVMTISRPTNGVALQKWTGTFENSYLKEQTEGE